MYNEESGFSKFFGVAIRKSTLLYVFVLGATLGALGAVVALL